MQQGPWFTLQSIFKSPMTLFVYAILYKWYIILMVGSITGTYWLFKALKDRGVIDYMDKTLYETVWTGAYVIKECTPSLFDGPKALWTCIQMADYVKMNDETEPEEAKELRKNLEKDGEQMNEDGFDKKNNPYRY